MRLLALVLLLGGALPAVARDLPVPADKGWKHAATGIVLRPTLAGLPRTALTDSTASEHDVVAAFESPDRATSATVYIFHAAPVDAALWFDRAETALMARDTYGGVTPAGAAPVAFARRNAAHASGLRRSYTPRKGPYRATALAVMPVADWIVALRVSSTAHDPAALDALVDTLLTSIGWPAATDPAPAATPIAPCPDRLAFAKAKQRKPDMMQALLGATIAGVAARSDAKMDDPRVPLCRDGEGTVAWGVYRPAAMKDGYTLALGDSGRSIGVHRPFVVAGLPSGYAVTLHDIDGSSASYPQFDKLPAPRQLFDTVMRSDAIARTQGDGKTITIDSGLTK